MYGTSVLHSRRVVRSSYRFYSNSTKKLLEFLADMPKSHNLRINETQRHRLNSNKKSNIYSPSNVYLQVLGSGARGAPNTLYLFTDHKRYLFNCGECTQRLAHEHKVKLSKLEHIFITGKSWKNIGGLPGLSLTLQDVGVPNITLHGPPGLDKLYEATKRFVVMKEMKVTMAETSSQEDFTDNVITVKYIVLQPQESIFKDKPPAKKPKLDDQDKEFEKFDHDNTDYYRSDRNAGQSPQNKVKPDKIRKGTPSPEFKKKELPFMNQSQSKSVIAYVVTLKKRMGTLDLAKCVELGVKPGPQLGQLKNGQDIILPNGVLVFSSDVKTPDDPGPVFIVMEVPDIGYLKECDFSAHFDNGVNQPENIPTLVVHMTPPHVFNDPVYQRFIAKFGQSTRHMILNSQNSCLGSEAVHRTQHKLHLLDTDIFPMLKDASVPAMWNSHPMPINNSAVSQGLEDLKNKIALAQFQNIINLEGSKATGDGTPSKDTGNNLDIISGRTLTTFHLRPTRQLDRLAEPKLHIQNYIQETMDMDGFVASLEQFRRLIDNLYKRDALKEYPKVLFLGTGSCIPSKTRNTSGIALQLSEKRSIILDCGEGTFGQMVRFFGPKKIDHFLRTIQAIYISHLHADHHIGLISLIQERREAFISAQLAPEPVMLLAPGQIYTWLHMYDQEFEKIKPDFVLVPNQDLLLSAEAKANSIGAKLGVESIQTCEVAHCPNAFGVAVRVDQDHKITYSGDTIPCDALAVIGMDSTLLIHEATMEDELVKDARVKMHSTTTQAIEMGRLMNAQFTVLTHFSQRYARLPRLNAQILNDNKSVGIAFDNMQITMDDLKVLPHMYAPLQLMFAEHCVEMELKAAHRAQHKERALRAAASSRQDREYTSRTPKSSNDIKPSRQQPSSPFNRYSNASRHTSRTPSKLSNDIKPSRQQPSPPFYRDSNASRHTSRTPKLSNDNQPRTSPPATPLKYKDGNASRHTSRTPKLSNDNQPRTSLPATPLKYRDSNASKLRCERKVLENMKIPIGRKPRSHSSSSKQRIVNAKSLSLYNSHHELQQAGKYLRSERAIDFDSSSLPNDDKEVPQTRIRSEKDKDLNSSSSKASSSYKEDISVNNKSRTPNCKRSTWCRRGSSVNSNASSGSNNSESKCSASSRSRELSLKSGGTQSLLQQKCQVAPLKNKLQRNVSETNHQMNKSPTPEDISATFCFSDRTSDAQGSRVSSPSSNGKPSKIPMRQQSAEKLRSYDRIKCNVTEKLKSLAESSPLRTSIEKLKSAGQSYPGKQKTATEKLKQQFCRDTPMIYPNNGRMHSPNKSFKPQLEDIKSSYLLLQNKKQTSDPLKTGPQPVVNEKMSKPHHKPIVINETQRKKLLQKSKQKFQSKFNNIEGLNWISW